MGEHDFTLTEMMGIREEGNELTQDPRYAARLENLRPEIGKLVKIKGNALHSQIGYKAASRPVTLIRWAKEDGTDFFTATAFDNVFEYVAEWIPLLAGASSSGDVPSNLLYYLNRMFDHCVYNGVLYLTDGANKPLKYDGSNIGTWGLTPFTGTNSPLTSTVQAGPGDLAAGTYRYYASLYDSLHELQANRNTAHHQPGANAGDENIWIHVNNAVDCWNQTDNYDYENGLADKIKIWRNGITGSDDLYLAGTIKKGLVVASTGSTVDGGDTGTLTDAATDFVALEVEAGDAVRINSLWKQVTVVAQHALTLVNDDGDGFTGVADGDYSYTIWGGFIDSDSDITAGTNSTGDDAERYHGELDTPEDHSPPERCKYCVVFGDRGNRAFMAGDADHPNRLYYSETGLVDYWPLENWIDIDPDDSDEITGLVKFNAKLYIFKRNSMAIGYVDGDPYTWVFGAKVLSMGAANRRVIAVCKSHMIFANAAGIWMWDGSNKPDLISHPEKGSNIRNLWNFVVKDELANSQAVYDAKNNEFLISVAFDDSRGEYDLTKTGRNVIFEGTT